MRLLRLILINMLILVVVGEIALRLLAPRLPGQIGVAARYVTTGSPYTEEWTPAWASNSDHFYALKPGLVDSLQYGSPLVSFRLTTNALWAGGAIGFRTRPVDFFVDAVVVGDSFGMCFTEQIDCWVDRLQSASSKNIVNLSQPVTGSQSHLKILQDYGAPLTPPLVIWQFFGNDFNDDYGLAVLRDEIAAVPDSAAVPEDSSPGMWLRRNSVLLAVVETLLNGRYLGIPTSETLFAKPYTVRFGQNNAQTMQVGGKYEQQALDMTRTENQIGLERSREAFIAAQSLVAGWDGQLVVVIIPTREEIYQEVVTPAVGAAYVTTLSSARTAMHTLCNTLALTCLDAYDGLRPPALAGDALYHVDDLHLNALGNQVLAAWLATQLPLANQ